MNQGVLQRRRTDAVLPQDRRQSFIDRRGVARQPVSVRFPTRQEQALQFLTRYLFAVLGLIFFNVSADFQPKWMSVFQMNILFGVYLLINTGCFIHAWLKPCAPARYRFALWIDLVLVTVCVANDPYDIPPSMAAYVVVVLGNGMRYGMRFFAEALTGSLLGGMLGLIVRYLHFPAVFSPGTVFLSLFGTIIVVYAYILMNRVERARNRTELVSRTDPLTGLYNRRGLSEAADTWLASARKKDRSCVVMFADLDNFKSVNDTRGHAEGDRALAQVALMLHESVRASDPVARYGGDEFVMLLADISGLEAEAVVGRIQNAVESWFRDKNLACGISIGYAEVPLGDCDIEQVLQSVDELLYQSKEKRKNNGLRRLDVA